jgi:hypothetical protein
MATIKHPFGDIQNVTIAATGATAVTINKTAYNSVIPELSGNATLTITAGADLRVGDMLHLAIKTAGTQTFTFAGDATAPVVTGVAGKTWTQSLVFNGAKFLPMGAKIQID